MNPYQSFLLSVATGAPFARMGETGDVEPAAPADGQYPAPPAFSINDLLPALKSERNKAIAGGVVVGVLISVTAVGLWYTFKGK